MTPLGRRIRIALALGDITAQAIAELLGVDHALVLAELIQMDDIEVNPATREIRVKRP